MDSIVVFCAKYLYLLVIAGLAVAWLRTNRKFKIQFVLATILACAIAFILSRIASHLYYDPRPFVAEHVKPLVPHAPDNGFPSDHALLTMTLTAITYFYSKKAAAGMLAVTVAVGVARILAKIHSPLDIGAGWVFGVAGAIAGYYLVGYVWARRQNKVPSLHS